MKIKYILGKIGRIEYYMYIDDGGVVFVGEREL